MDSEQILKGINDDDVISFTKSHEKKTFCIAEFRTIIRTTADAMKRAYAESLISQGHQLHTDWSGRHPTYDGWFDDSGAKCKLLCLGDSQWKHGKVRIRIELEFIPDGEEDSNQIDENPLDTFR
jgi:hypothetical protein